MWEIKNTQIGFFFFRAKTKILPNDCQNSQDISKVAGHDGEYLLFQNLRKGGRGIATSRRPAWVYTELGVSLGT